MSSMQILAFVSGLAGLGATIGATVSNEWRATSRASSVITATWVLQGLWNNCAGNAIGALHCRPHHTILKLEGKTKIISQRPHTVSACVFIVLHDALVSVSSFHGQEQHEQCVNATCLLTCGKLHVCSRGALWDISQKNMYHLSIKSLYLWAITTNLLLKFFEILNSIECMFFTNNFKCSRLLNTLFYSTIYHLCIVFNTENSFLFTIKSFWGANW